MQARTIEVSGITTHYLEEGSGAPLVLLHGSDFGAGSGGLTWHRNIGPLSEHYRVVAPDRLGQGRTGAPLRDEDYTIDAILDHLEAFLDALDIRDATVMGSSRGAFVATYLAMRRPDLVARLGITNSASLAPAYAAHHYPARRNLRGTPEAVRADNAWLSYTDAHITTEWEQEVAAALDSPSCRQARAKFTELRAQYYASFDVAKRDVVNWLRAGFGKPSLVVWGLADPMTRLEDALELLRFADGFPRLYLMDRCGHLPFAEYAEEFNGVLRTFIETSDEAQALGAGARR